MAEQCDTLSDLYDWCLTNHYKNNDHHPEYFSKADNQLPEIDEMPKIARLELTCDLLGCALGVFNKKDIPVSLSECRAKIENDKWRHWKYAIKDDLPAASHNIPSYGNRWKKFPPEEYEKLNRIFLRVKQGVHKEMIRRDLLQLESVQYYLNDHHHHKKAVYEVWKSIPEFKEIPGLEDRVKRHDNDKYDTMMILGYTAKWCF